MLPFLMQVYKNVAEYQFTEYVKSKGKDPNNLTDGEKAELRTNMTGDLYPGEYCSTYCSLDVHRPTWASENTYFHRIGQGSQVPRRLDVGHHEPGEGGRGQRARQRGI